MRTKCLLPFVAAVLLVACQKASDSTTTDGKAAKPSEGGGGVLSAFKPEPVILPEGTTLHLIMETALSSATNKNGDLVVAKLADDVKVGDKVVLTRGTELKGEFTPAVPSGLTKGLARLSSDFALTPFTGTVCPSDARATFNS